MHDSSIEVLELSVAGPGKSLVMWLWTHARDMVVPTVRAEVEQRTRAIAYDGDSAVDVNREVTRKFQCWYEFLAPLLDETNCQFEGHRLIQLLHSYRHRSNWDPQFAVEVAEFEGFGSETCCTAAAIWDTG